MVLVPFGPLRWYRLVRYGGTDSTATLVPIDRYYQVTRPTRLRLTPTQAAAVLLPGLQQGCITVMW